MSQFETDNAHDDEKDGNQPDEVVRIAKENDATDNCPSRTDSRPHCVGCSNGDRLHRLRDSKKAEDNKNHGNHAGNKPRKALAKFQSDGKANFKKTR